MYKPKFFPAHQYQTLLFLCDTIIPNDEVSGGAVEAGAPEFIDLLTSENEKYQLTLGGGLMWLDNFCSDRYAHTFLECDPEQRKEVLGLIAYRKNSLTDPSLSQGIAFFARLRAPREAKSGAAARSLRNERRSGWACGWSADISVSSFFHAERK